MVPQQDEKSPLLSSRTGSEDMEEASMAQVEQSYTDRERLMLHYDGASSSSRTKYYEHIHVCCARAGRNWKTIGLGLFLVMSLMTLAEMNTKMTYILIGAGKPTFEQLTASMNQHESFINVFTDPSNHQLFALDFPIAILENPQPVVFSSIFYRGTLNDFTDETESYLYMPAENTDETVFEFRLTDDRQGVDVVRLGLTTRTHDAQMEEVTEKSLFEGWEATLPLLAVKGEGTPNKRVLVDATTMVENGFYITDIAPPLLGDAPRLVLNETRSFPRNFDVVAEYRLMADPETMTTADIALMFSVARLPEEPMAARAADERVGYFTSSYTDLGDYRAPAGGPGRASDQVDRQVDMIQRRRLEKGGEPLVYYVDPTVPEQWRPAMKAGVEAWQAAFEAIGFGGEAIKAVLPGEDAWPEDYHVGDVRYNTISWAIDTSSVFALGPSTVDPRTGEILKSNIVFTNGWLKSWLSTFETLDAATVPTPGADRRRLEADGHGHAHAHAHGSHGHPHQRRRALSSLSKALSPSHSHFDAHDHDHDHDHAHGGSFGLGAGHPVLALLAQRPSATRTGRTVRGHDWRACRDARLANPSLELARVALSLGADGGQVPDAIIAQGWTDVAMHEVGHTLGLRHNFKGSTGVTLEQLQDPEYTGRNGLTASVMDYLPLNILGLELSGEGGSADYFSPVIGTYDKWAIEYGYAEVDSEDSSATGTPLAAVAERALPFGTDEDGARAQGADPHNVAFDLSDDPVRYYEEGILGLVRQLRPTLLDRAVYVGEPFTYYASYERALLNQIRTAGVYLAKFVGGFEVTKQRRLGADQEGPLKVYDVEKQRKALGLIMGILAEDPDDTLLPRAEQLPYMAQRDGECEGLMQYCYAVTPYEILEKVDLLRGMVLENLLDPDRLSRIRAQEWYGKNTGSDHLPLSEFFSTLTSGLWGEDLTSGAADNRNWATQALYLDYLMELQCLQVGASGEVAALAAGELYKVKAAIDAELPSAAGTAAYPQLAAAQRKINLWQSSDSYCEEVMELAIMDAAQGGRQSDSTGSKLMI